MSEKKERENRKAQAYVGPEINLRMNPQTGMPMIDSNLTEWWRVTYMLTLALHAAADLAVKERMGDEKKVLVVPAMPGLKEMES